MWHSDLPQNKHLGLKLTEVGEMLRRILLIAAMMISKLDVMKAASSLQACGGQETGAEATIHGVHNIIKIKIER